MTPALGTAEKSQITEYKDVTGYILFRKPAQIHIIGLYPVIRSKAFDMASTAPILSSTFRRAIFSSPAATRSANPRRTKSKTCARNTFSTPCWCVPSTRPKTRSS